MSRYVQRLSLGQAKVTVISIGEAQYRLVDQLNLPPGERPWRYQGLLEQDLRRPTQCIHVELPGMSLMVDVSLYDFTPDSPFHIHGYEPPPGLLARLAEEGVQPDSIDRVVITHGHFDHYNGSTIERDGHIVPCFPGARHYLGRADWEDAEFQKMLTDPESLPSRTLGVIQQQGLLELVDGNLDLGHGVEIIAAPGETPGHQIVRVRHEGETLYCVGDLYHHPIEFQHPNWNVHWADAQSNIASRQALMEEALSENALLVATHIAGAGRLERTADGVTWVAV